MPGAISTISHEGSRSENLAICAFSSWGTVVSTPTPQDYGIDLHCTLVDKIGNRAWARSPFTVQVKSNTDPWLFDGEESVRWLIQHPLPLFLCVVEKSTARLRLYHTAPRFYVWSLGTVPERLTLRPGTGTVGRCTQWEGSYEFALSAPILDFAFTDTLDEDFHAKARKTLDFWISVDNNNLDRIRAGLLKFRMPDEYKTNETDFRAWVEQGVTRADEKQIEKALIHLNECLEWTGSQLFQRSDFQGAVRASLLFRHVFNKYSHLFDRTQEGSHLTPVFMALKDRLSCGRMDYLYAGVEHLATVLDDLIADDSGSQGAEKVDQCSSERRTNVDWQDRISVDPKVLVGKPVIKGTRISVEFLMELLANGWTHEQILKNYPHLTAEDIQAALHYAAETVKQEHVYPLPV